jgi:hypothetical protein
MLLLLLLGVVGDYRRPLVYVGVAGRLDCLGIEIVWVLNRIWVWIVAVVIVVLIVCVLGNGRGSDFAVGSPAVAGGNK